MRFKPDWEKVKKRYEAFWEGEILDRALFYVIAPDKKSVQLPETPLYPKARFTDIEYLFECSWATIESTYWGADALPVLQSSCGAFFPDCLFGSEPAYGDTVWMKPCAASCEELLEMEDIPDFSNPFLKTQEKYLNYLCEIAQGQCMVSMPWLTPGLDSLANIIGASNLCIEIVENLSGVKQLLEKIDKIWVTLYERFKKIASDRNAELTHFLPLWAPGRFAALQCDFMVMINQEMFKSFGMPSLYSCSSYLDYYLFHLDGKEALHHLETLLNWKELPGIQWQQGSNYYGTESIIPWIPLLQKIQAAGKKVYVSCISEEVEIVMESLSSRNLFLATAADTIEEARELEGIVSRLTHD